MLRFIIRRQMRDQWNGLETDGMETVDIDVPELERILTGGGFSEKGYDARSIAGVEVLPAAAAEPTESACPHCDDLGWGWEHGLDGESWKVQCHLHCAAAVKWMAEEHGVAATSSQPKPDSPL